MRHALALGLLLAAAWAWAQTCAVPGWNGPATASGVLNTYHGGSGSPAAGATSITVQSANGQRSNTRALRAGDLILIMQMQDSATPANAGQFEYAQIVAVSGATLSLNRPLSNSYAQVMDTSNVRNWQVVYVPQYSALTVTASVSADRFAITATTGVATGGVTALDVAGSLSLSGTITAAGSGFRGAAGINGTSARPGGTYTDANYNMTTTVGNYNGSLKGEGIEGTPFLVFDGTATPQNYNALLGQGYSGGAGGRAARGNAGGGGNDGDPAGDANGLNSGGGGGGNGGAGGRGGNAWNNGTTTASLNQPAGGLTGNEAGGLGGAAQSNGATRLPMGGGGGAGSANNSGASSVTTWPPGTSTAANGASGAIASSGASGGGVVMVRVGTISGAGAIVADGYNAFNKAPTSATDSAGGGGAGGSIFVTAGSGVGTGVRLLARGGYGGRSNYYNHGPGGGGGGGYIQTNLTGATTDVSPGLNGLDACCGGTTDPGGGSPRTYNAAPGSAGTVVTTAGTPAGVLAGAACLPNVAVVKSTTTPLISTTTGATAVYTINASNSGGAATNLYLFDVALPPGWTYLTAPTTTYTYSPAPPPAANSNAAGAETTAAVLPVGFPVATATTVNSVTGVSLRAAGVPPGVVPSAAAGTLSFGSFYLPQNGSISVSFAVSIPNTATVGTYHNAAGAAFLDPTRVTTAARMVVPATNVSANRNATALGSNTTFASGSTTTVLGSHHSGLAGGPTSDNVRLLADLSVTKTGPATATSGVTTGTYSIVGRNNGRRIGTQTYSLSQATDVTAANVPATSGANPIQIVDALPPGLVLNATPTGTNWSCTVGTGSTTFTCSYFLATPANGYPIAASTNLTAVTASVSFTAAPCGLNTTNTASISLTPQESLTSNNTASAVTAVSCTANLAVTKTNNVTSLGAGSTTSYTVTFSNAGPSQGDGSVLRDSSSAGLTGCAVLSCSTLGSAVCPASGVWPNLLTPGGLTYSAFPAYSSLTFVIQCGVSATGQ